MKKSVDMQKSILMLTLFAFALAGCGGAAIPPLTAAPDLPPADGGEVGESPSEPVETPTEAVVYSGSCANNYYPIREGVTLSYVFITPGQPNVEMLISFSEVNAEGFTVTQNLDDEITLQSRWLCSEEGLIAVEYGSVAFAATGYELVTVGYSGVQVPLESEMTPDSAWSSQFDVQGTFNNASGSGEAELLITESSVGLGFIAVTVPAGTFENTFQVETRSAIEITHLVEGEAIGTVTVNSLTTTWYAEGIGIVRQETNAQGVVTIMELLEIQE
jgi:hypothetical protein